MNRKDCFEVAKLVIMWLALVSLFGLIFGAMWIYTGPALTIFVGGAIALFLLFNTPGFRRWWSRADKDWEEALFSEGNKNANPDADGEIVLIVEDDTLNN